MDQHRKANLLSEVTQYPLRFCTPFVFGYGSQIESLKICNGTMTLVNFGDGPFGITCWHCIEPYVKLRAKGEKLLLKIGDASPDLNLNLIDHCPTLDLATIKFSEEELQEIRASYGDKNTGCDLANFTIHLENIRSEEDKVAFAGFPGGGWRKRAGSSLSFDPFSATHANITFKDLNQIKCRLDDLDGWPRVVDNNKTLSDPGGLSGGPVFIMTQRPILKWALIGIIFEGTFLFEGPHLDICIRPIHYIKSDGTLLKANHKGHREHT